MRLLPVGADHGGGQPSFPKSVADRRRHRFHDDQYLPLRDLSAHSRRHPPRRRARKTLSRECASMNATLSRRSFIASGVSAAGGLLVAVALPRLAAALPLGPEPWG